MTIHDFQPLSLAAIEAAIDPATRLKIDDIIIHQSVASTNDVLWQRFSEGQNSPAICLSESQTAGRGRRGDRWHSPSVGNLYLSIFWPFPAETVSEGLSIAVGISLIETLKTEGINDLQLKWPNDVLYKRQKLAGILVESRFGKNQNTVVGIGLNFKLPTATKNKIHQPTTSLQQLCTKTPCRSRLAGKIIQNMITTLELVQRRGLIDFIPQWPQYDALANHPVTLISDKYSLNVIARGINERGELRYEHENTLHTLSNSHVSIRFSS